MKLSPKPDAWQVCKPRLTKQPGKPLAHHQAQAPQRACGTACACRQRALVTARTRRSAGTAVRISPRSCSMGSHDLPDAAGSCWAQARARASSRMSSRPCLSHSLRRPGRKAGGGVRKPPSPRMGSTMTAAVSLGAVCCFRIHSMASSGPLQQVRALYESYGGTLGATCARRPRSHPGVHGVSCRPASLVTAPSWMRSRAPCT